MSVTALALLASAALASVTPAGVTDVPRAHPMHSTLTEVVQDEARGTLRLTIRVFADDFGLALARASGVAVPPAGPGWETAALRYAATVVGVRDARGGAVALRPCGIRRTSGVLWLCLETTALTSTQGVQLLAGMLCELYDDQVNVVQVVIGGVRRSMLFVHGDGYKSLR